MNEEMKRVTLGLLAVFAVFLIIWGLRAMLLYGHADVKQLTLATSSQVTYIPLKPSNLHSLKLESPSFSESSSVIYTIFLMAVIICASRLYYKAALRQYLNNLETYQAAFKEKEPSNTEGESDETSI